MTLREAIEYYVQDGFRDEDGVWHEGPHRVAALAELDNLVAIADAADEQVRLYSDDTIPSLTDAVRSRASNSQASPDAR